jgi:DNA mismatch repair protein MutS2
VIELVELENIDWTELKSRMSDFATSEQARQSLSELEALEDSVAAKQSVKIVMEATHVLHTGKRPHMESLDLFHSWHSRLEKKATLRNMELRDLRHFCHEVLALKEVLTEVDSPRLRNLSSGLLPAEEPLSAIDQILTADGNIRNDASEKIYQLTRERNQKTQELQSSLDRLVKDHEMEDVLQDKYVTTREGRWVLPVKSGMRHNLEGVIHSSSQSKQTVFMEPQIVIPLNNRLRQIEVELEEEIERLLTQLSEYLFSLVEEFQRSFETLLDFDVRLAEAQLSLQLNAQDFQFSEDEISGFYFYLAPMLEEKQSS